MVESKTITHVISLGDQNYTRYEMFVVVQNITVSRKWFSFMIFSRGLILKENSYNIRSWSPCMFNSQSDGMLYGRRKKHNLSINICTIL